MRSFDADKERSERKLSTVDFLKFYNENLPPEYPPASTSFLLEFKKTYPALFKNKDEWSLDQHRKKFMDWLPQRTKPIS